MTRPAGAPYAPPPLFESVQNNVSGASGKIPGETRNVFRGSACLFTALVRQANLPDAPVSVLTIVRVGVPLPPPLYYDNPNTVVGSTENVGVLLATRRAKHSKRPTIMDVKPLTAPLDDRAGGEERQDMCRSDGDNERKEQPTARRRDRTEISSL